MHAARKESRPFLTTLHHQLMFLVHSGSLERVSVILILTLKSSLSGFDTLIFPISEVKATLSDKNYTFVC